MRKSLGTALWALVVVLFLSPMPVAVVNSLKTFQEVLLKPLSLPAVPQWQNYAEVYVTTNFIQVFTTTVIIVAASVAGVVLLSSMVGYRLARTKTVLSGFLFGLILLSMMVPFQTIMIPIVRVAQIFKLRGNAFSLIPIYIGMSGAMAVLLYHGFSNGIPLAMEESARMDGCCGLNMFFRIVFPLFSPVTATVSVLYVLQ